MRNTLAVRTDGSRVIAPAICIDEKNRFTRKWLDNETHQWLNARQTYHSFGAYRKLLDTLVNDGKVATLESIRTFGKRGGVQEVTLYSSSDIEGHFEIRVFDTDFENVQIAELQAALVKFPDSERLLAPAIKCVMRSSPDSGRLFASEILQPLVVALEKTFGPEAAQALLAISRLKRPERTKVDEYNGRVNRSIPATEQWNLILENVQECCKLLLNNRKIIVQNGIGKEIATYKATVEIFEDSMSYRLNPPSHFSDSELTQYFLNFC